MIKYDLKKKTNRFAKRTLDSFSNAMCELISEKSFESIKVSEVCNKAKYPRATFYNYFEDKYDLLNYCSMIFSEKINLEECLEKQPEIRLFEIFNRMYDFINDNNDKVKKIIKVNEREGELINNFRFHLKKKIIDVMNQCECTNNYKIPYEIIAEHYSNTIMMIIDWSLLKNKGLTKEDSNKYLHLLLDSI